MGSGASRVMTDVDFDKEGFQTGTLKVPHSVDRSAYGFIPIPVATRKRGTGPTVLLIGGNHGDEYEGPLALMKLLPRVRDDCVNGRIIVIPALNYPAVVAGTRVSPIDGGNLNRMFPGKRDGTVTEIIAHYVFTEIFPKADLIIDIHSGGSSLNHIPTLLLSVPDKPAIRQKYIELASIFGAPYAMILDTLGEDRTTAASAVRQEKLFISGEFGGFGTCDPDSLSIVENGLLRVLNAFGVLESEHVLPSPRIPSFLEVLGEGHYVFSQEVGLFEPAVKLGDAVSRGQIAGRIYDVNHPWRDPVELLFKEPGMVVCIRSSTGVQPGDCLVLCAVETSLRTINVGEEK